MYKKIEGCSPRGSNTPRLCKLLWLNKKKKVVPHFNNSNYKKAFFFFTQSQILVFKSMRLNRMPEYL